MRVILVGYMASGKSSIGKKLAKKHQLPFLDLDDYIVEQEGLDIPTIFKTKGEIYFRKVEAAYLEKIVKEKAHFILAVGGGTPCYGINMEIINKNATSIYLKSSLQNTCNKLSKLKNKSKRPLIAGIAPEDLKEFIAKHLFERTPFYEQAKIIVSIDNKSKKELVTEISSLI